MVQDQVVHRTMRALVELSPGILRIEVPEEEAGKLCGFSEHVVHFPAEEKAMREIDAALKVIFAGSGEYRGNMRASRDRK